MQNNRDPIFILQIFLLAASGAAYLEQVTLSLLAVLVVIIIMIMMMMVMISSVSG